MSKKEIKPLKLMVQVYAILNDRGRCYLKTDFGGILVVKQKKGKSTKYRLYPIYRFKPNVFYPMKGINDIYELFQKAQWKILGVR